MKRGKIEISENWYLKDPVKKDEETTSEKFMKHACVKRSFPILFHHCCGYHFECGCFIRLVREATTECHGHITFA